MSYRRLKYRYAMVLSGRGAALPSDGWRVGVASVVAAQPHWRPAADVYETAERVHVTVELAGVRPDDVEAALYEDALLVTGRRWLPPVDPAGRYQSAEIRQGSFRLELTLPAPVDVDRIEGGLEHGLLRLTLAKLEA